MHEEVNNLREARRAGCGVGIPATQAAWPVFMIHSTQSMSAGRRKAQHRATTTATAPGPAPPRPAPFDPVSRAARAAQLLTRPCTRCACAPRRRQPRPASASLVASPKARDEASGDGCFSPSLSHCRERPPCPPCSQSDAAGPPITQQAGRGGQKSPPSPRAARAGGLSRLTARPCGPRPIPPSGATFDRHFRYSAPAA